jgi:glycosyltransferase involved in cell wall biosynthesis
MFKLVLSIRSLNIGGAERQFIELIKNIDKKKFKVSVCTMYGGEQEEIVKNITDIEYINLEKKGRYDFIHFYKNYSRFLKKQKPDVIYSFLGEMNFFSLLCKTKQSKIIWGFRASNMDLKQYGKVSQLLFFLQKIFSHKVDKIIANSKASIDFHKAAGFDMTKSCVIYNGIDTKKFYKNQIKRQELREKFSIDSSAIVIGIVARIDCMKGHLVFAEVAKKIFNQYQNIYFFAVGSGDDDIKKECNNILNNNKSFFWLGEQNSVEDYYNLFDIVVSASIFGEGFSNSIAEAMSCECTCVVTNVGESAYIVGESGIVARPKSVESLFEALNRAINCDFVSLGKKSRQRILDNFSIQTMVEKTENEILKCVE